MQDTGYNRQNRRRAKRRQLEEARARADETVERKRRTTRLALIGTAVALIAVVAVAIAVTVQQGRQQDAAARGKVQTFSVQQGHTEGPTSYAQTPPAGGVHNPAWLNCGYYPAPVPNQYAVHSLEHGAVWITYRPDLPAAQVDALRGRANAQTFMLVSPYPDLPAPVVASAWGKQVRLDSASDPALDTFIRDFRQGPQTPEPGAACTGGVGTPE